MTTHLETITAAVSTLTSAFLGSKLFVLATEMASSSQAGPMPEWLGWLIGPLGALVGMVAAITWLTRRLNRAEEREEERRKEREESLKTMVAANIRSADAIEQNSQILASVKEVLQRKP
jgi:hypothetical protein